MGDVIVVPGDFEEEFGSLYRLARTVALRILGSVADAEDAAAEALTRTLVDWSRVGRLDHREAWVQRVAANVAIDVVRRRGPSERARETMRRQVVSAGTDRGDETVLSMALSAALAQLVAAV